MRGVREIVQQRTHGFGRVAMCQGECFFVEAELGLTAAKKRPDSFRFVFARYCSWWNANDWCLYVDF